MLTPDDLAAIRAIVREEMATKANASAPRHASTSSGATLPNYGRRKGEPIEGAPIADLEYYANGCRRSLDDPAKSRWHAKERETLAAIEAEITRQNGAGNRAVSGGGSAFDSLPTDGDDSIPF